MMMRLIFGYGAFFLCFSTIAADDMGGGLPGGCFWGNVTEEDLIEDKNLREGKKIILDNLLDEIKKNYDYAGDYEYKVDIPDLQVCQQVVAGSLYNFRWFLEDYTVQCVLNDFCGDYHKNWTATPNCNASYAVQDWLKHTEFNGPFCGYL